MQLIVRESSPTRAMWRAALMRRQGRRRLGSWMVSRVVWWILRGNRKSCACYARQWPSYDERASKRTLSIRAARPISGETEFKRHLLQIWREQTSKEEARGACRVLPQPARHALAHRSHLSPWWQRPYCFQGLCHQARH